MLSQGPPEHQLMPATEVSPDSLESFRVGGLQTIWYIPEYVSESEESCILRNLNSAKSRWTQVDVDMCVRRDIRSRSPAHAA